MERIQWSEELSLGIEQIDGQHKELIRIANGLISAVAKERGNRVINNVVRRLRNYTVFHFNSEEKLMEAVRYPKRGEHENEHAKLKRNVKEFQRNLYQGERLTAEDVLNFLKIWLLKHILYSDRMLADFIHESEKSGNNQQ